MAVGYLDQEDCNDTNNIFFDITKDFLILSENFQFVRLS